MDQNYYKFIFRAQFIQHYYYDSDSTLWFNLNLVKNEFLSRFDPLKNRATIVAPSLSLCAENIADRLLAEARGEKLNFSFLVFAFCLLLLLFECVINGYFVYLGKKLTISFSCITNLEWSAWQLAHRVGLSVNGLSEFFLIDSLYKKNQIREKHYKIKIIYIKRKES